MKALKSKFGADLILIFSFLFFEGGEHVLCQEPIKIISDYYEAGELKSKVAMKGNKKFGYSISFYASGQIWAEFVYDNGSLNGPSVLYYENGQVMRKGRYKNDAPDGIHFFYEVDGSLTKKGEYKEGTHDGIWKFFYEGKLDKEILYRNDTICKIIIDNKITAPFP
jgi:hypothetical protein